MQTEPKINMAQTFSSRSEILSGVKVAQPTVAAHSSWAEQNSRLHDELGFRVRVAVRGDVAFSVWAEFMNRVRV